MSLAEGTARGDTTMRVRSFVLPGLAAALVLCGPLLGYAVGARRPDSPSKPKSHHVYRLDYVVSVTEPGKAPTTSTHTMNVEEDHTSDVRAGANVPLVSGSSGAQASPRQDVGLLIQCHLTRAGDDLLLQNTTELSAVDERADPGPRAIRKIVAKGDAVASLGKPAVVASVQEPVSHAQYEVTVTATKLR
jgi:hypothetical protein